MKPYIRVLGIDDAPFRFSQKEVIVVGAVIRVPGYLEGVMKTVVQVDGMDSTSMLLEMFKTSRFKQQIRLIMLDGIALGGFNIVDVKTLNKESGIPVCTITRDKPDMDSIKMALKKKFTDWKPRWELMENNKLVKMETSYKPIYVSCVGIKDDELRLIIENSTVRGALPEPIRAAHLIASAMRTGESYGGA
jgi:endonuclease V-like protein UPF0215 family